MIDRVLPEAEWSRLGADAEALIAQFHSPIVRPIVVEEQGEIVGRWILMSMIHAEGIAIHPDWRHSPSVGRHLLRGMQIEAYKLGAKFIWTGSDNEAVTKLLAHPRIGAAAVPMLPFLIPVRT